MRVFISSVVVVLFAASAQAWETDNYSCNKEKIGDSRSEVNAETNRRIKKALEQVNSVSPEVAKNIRKRFEKTVAIRELMRDANWDNEIGQLESDSAEFDEPRDPASLDGRISDLGVRGRPDSQETDEKVSGGCSYSGLEKALENQLASPWMGNMETWADQAPIPKCDAGVEKSVFSAFNVSDARVAHVAGLNPVININGYQLGIDKLSHFMTEGLDYARTRRKGGSLKDALEIGIREEEGGYGWSATGVKSYGDMSANYKGSLFWGSLTEGPNPYFECRKGKWIQRREFDWSDYVDASLNESINCSEFKTAEMNSTADQYSEKLYSGDPRFRSRCPVVEGACAEIVASLRPPEALKTIVHPKCLKDGGASRGDAPMSRGFIPSGLGNPGRSDGGQK